MFLASVLKGEFLGRSNRRLRHSNLSELSFNSSDSLFNPGFLQRNA
jgi:hypothetical protein